MPGPEAALRQKSEKLTGNTDSGLGGSLIVSDWASSALINTDLDTYASVSVERNADVPANGPPVSWHWLARVPSIQNFTKI